MEPEPSKEYNDYMAYMRKIWERDQRPTPSKKMKVSTWMIIGSVVLTTFMAQPTLASLIVHALNVLLLMATIWVAHHESRIYVDVHRRPPSNGSGAG